MIIRTLLVSCAIALCAASGLCCAAAREQEPRRQGATEQPARPTLSLGPAAGLPGSTVTARGSGFRGDCLVRLSFDGENGPLLGTAEVDTAGSFSVQLVIPDQAAGERHVVLARGLRPGTTACTAPSDDKAEAVFVLTPDLPTLVIDTREARPGGTVHIEGRGFCADSGCSAVTVLIDGQVAAGGIAVSPSGSFGVEARVPATKTAGTLAVAAVQTLADQTERRAFGTLEVTPRPNGRREPE